MPDKFKITDIRSAGPFAQVVTVEGDKSSYRKKPCPGCPWVRDNDGDFPAEAFRHSAATAYDMSQRVFACHESGTSKPAVCAGFLLRGAAHNLTVRLGLMSGRFNGDVSDAGLDLHPDYRSMAIANGVSEDDPSLAPCRGA